MRNLRIAGMMTLACAAALIAVSDVQAQQCTTEAALGDTGVIASGDDICEVDGADDLEPPTSCSTLNSGRDLQLDWQPSQSGLYTLTTEGTVFDTVLYVYEADGTAADCQTIDEAGVLACDLDSTPDDITSSTITRLSVTAGERYTIVLDSRVAACGAYTLESMLERGCPDQSAGSAVGENVVSVSTCTGSSLATPTCGNGGNRQDVTVGWEAPADGTYSFSVEGDQRVTLAILEGDCSSNELACSTDGMFDFVTGSETVTVADVSAGDVLTILVEGRQTCDDYDISIRAEGCNPTDIGSVLGDGAYASAIAAGASEREASCDTNLIVAGNEDYLLWTAPYSGEFTFTQTGINASLEILAGGCEGDSLACSDPLVNINDPSVDVDLSAGESVIIIVDGEETGDYALDISGVGCGDGLVQAGEDCDGSAGTNEVGVSDCDTLTSGERPVGDVACTTMCEFDTTMCIGACDPGADCEPRDNATALCDVEGACTYRCAEGFADCNDDLSLALGEGSDGCEVDITTTTDCGGCGLACGDTQTCDADAELGFVCTGSATCYTDSDDDGFGDAAALGEATTTTCPVGTAPNNLDCDDALSTVNPAAEEVCDGVDNDCDGTADNEGDDLCPAPDNASGVCEGQDGCTIVCEEGFADEDDNPANGCEVNLDPGEDTGVDADEDVGPDEDTGVPIEGSGAFMSGGQGFGQCSATSRTTGGAAALLMLLGLFYVRRRR